MLVGKKYVQMAWVVDDLNLAVRQWQETAKIGPFFIGNHIGGMITDGQYRGQPTEIDMSCAVAQAGPVQIELIKQHGSDPSPYREVYPEGTSGFHHICSFVDDVAAERHNYGAHGIETAMSGMVMGRTPFVYMDTRPTLGCMTELFEADEILTGMFGAIAAAATDWDGKDPIRDFASLAG